MRKRLMKIAAWLAAVAAAIAVVLVAVVEVRSRRTFDAAYPEIHASNDPAVVARGRYLAYGPAHCVACHTNKAEQEAIKAGAMPPLAGGGEFVLPLGKVYTPNLTPDVETGISRVSDGELARVLRFGVMPDGRAAVHGVPRRLGRGPDCNHLVPPLPAAGTAKDPAASLQLPRPRRAGLPHRADRSLAAGPPEQPCAGGDGRARRVPGELGRRLRGVPH